MATSSIVDFAILAPVPEEHLISGQPVAEREGFVAFGSMKWELFATIEKLRAGEPVPMLIYPSHDDMPGKLTFSIAWTGWYVGYVASRGGAHPEKMKHRPETTLKYKSDNSGTWAIFWHVRDLKQLPASEVRAISSFHSYKTGFWKMDHPPLGPEIVARPSWI